MTSKWLIFIVMFLIIFLLNSDAKARGGGSKSRISAHSYSAGNLSNESPQDPGRAILAVIFMILSCGGGIGWKIYRCYRTKERPKCVQPQIPYPNIIFSNSMSTPISNRLNETNLSSTRYPVTSSSIESFDHTSEKVIDEKPLEEIQIQKTRSKEEQCSINIPTEDVCISSSSLSRANRISTLL